MWSHLMSFQIYVSATPTSILQFWSCRQPRKGLWFALSKGVNSFKQGNEVETNNIPAMHPVLLVVSLCSCHGSRRIRDDCLVPVCLVRTLSSLRMSVAAAQRKSLADSISRVPAVRQSLQVQSAQVSVFHVFREDENLCREKVESFDMHDCRWYGGRQQLMMMSSSSAAIAIVILDLPQYPRVRGPSLVGRPALQEICVDPTRTSIRACHEPHSFVGHWEWALASCGNGYR